MLLDREREVGAALDRGIVDDNHTLLAHDATDAGDDSCGGSGAIVHTKSSKL